MGANQKRSTPHTNLPVARLENQRDPSELMKYRDRHLMDAIERKLRDTGRFTVGNATTLPILARQTVQGRLSVGLPPGFIM